MLCAAHLLPCCRVAYHLQQLATANISTKVVVLSLFATPFILLFGYMYHKAAHVKFGAAMYKASTAVTAS